MQELTQSQMAEHDAATFALIRRQMSTGDQMTAGGDAIHRMAGDTKELRYGKYMLWSMSREDAVAVVTEMAGVTAGSPEARNLLERQQRLTREYTALGEEIAGRESVWREQPWTRYFPCLNADGHIHSSLRSCPTIDRGMKTTDMGWETSLSGLPVGAAIEALGPRLCSVCFPDAPAEHCRSLRDITRAAREAEKAARQEAKYVKALRPEEVFRGYNGRVTTVNGCLEELRSEVEFRDYYGRGEHPFHADSAKGAETAKRVLLAREAAAPGTGRTQEQIGKVIANAVKRNIRDGARLNADGTPKA